MMQQTGAFRRLILTLILIPGLLLAVTCPATASSDMIITGEITSLPGSVSADSSPGVSPTVATYDLDDPADIAFTVTPDGVAGILSVSDTAGELVREEDYTYDTPKLTIHITYLSSALGNIGDAMDITIEFDTGDSVIVTIQATGTHASVFPRNGYFNPDNPVDVMTVVTMSPANSVVSIRGDDDLLPGRDYDVTGNILHISTKYLQTVLDRNTNSILLIINFDFGNYSVLTIRSTDTAGNDSLNPSVVSFDLGKPRYVYTSINSVTGKTIQYVYDNEGQLTAGSEYMVEDGELIIMKGYLVNALHHIGDCIGLSIRFDNNTYATLVITAVGDQPSLAPLITIYDINGGKPINTVITWGDDATAIDAVTASRNGSSLPGPLVPDKDYTLSNSLLSIQHSYLKNIELEVGDRLLFMIDFDYGKTALLTVTADAITPAEDTGTDATVTTPTPVIAEGFMASGPEVDEEGIVRTAAFMTTEARDASLSIPTGTAMKNAGGGPLVSVTAAAIETPPAPYPSGTVAVIYDFGPDGATFSPAVTLRMSFDPDSLPDGVTAADIAIARYDDASSEWTALPGTVDITGGTAEAAITHFSIFGLIIEDPPAPTTPYVNSPTPTASTTDPAAPAGTDTPDPGETAAPSTQVTEPTTTAPFSAVDDRDSDGISWWVYLLIGIAAVSAIAAVTYSIMKNRTPENRA